MLDRRRPLRQSQASGIAHDKRQVTAVAVIA